MISRLPQHHNNHAWSAEVTEQEMCHFEKRRNLLLCSHIRSADNVAAKNSSLPFARFPQSRLTAFGVHRLLQLIMHQLFFAVGTLAAVDSDSNH